jgi:hypothetical protein
MEALDGHFLGLFSAGRGVAISSIARELALG